MVADARQVLHDRDPQAFEVCGRADPGELQELRGVDRAAGQDHLAGVDPLRAAAAPGNVDADGPAALEADPRHELAGPDLEVPAAHDRVEVGARGAEPTPPVDVAVERREALLPVAVDVVGQVVARLLAGREERGEERVGGRTALQHQRAVMAPPRIVGRGRQARLHLLEVGQAVGVVPGRHAGIGRPALVVERVAALEDLPVDARRAAEDLAAGVVDAPAVHERLGLGLVLPVVEPAADREGQRRGHVDEDVEAVVRPAGLEHEHAIRGRGAESVRERAPG